MDVDELLILLSQAYNDFLKNIYIIIYNIIPDLHKSTLWEN
jgi:hypothetical protein